jgi:hypothetical protein
LFEHALGLENADSFAQRRPTDIELLQELGFGREGSLVELRIGNYKQLLQRPGAPCLGYASGDEAIAKPPRKRKRFMRFKLERPPLALGRHDHARA